MLIGIECSLTGRKMARFAFYLSFVGLLSAAQHRLAIRFVRSSSTAIMFDPITVHHIWQWPRFLCLPYILLPLSLILSVFFLHSFCFPCDTLHSAVYSGKTLERFFLMAGCLVFCFFSRNLPILLKPKRWMHVNGAHFVSHSLSAGFDPSNVLARGTGLMTNISSNRECRIVLCGEVYCECH